MCSRPERLRLAGPRGRGIASRGAAGFGGRPAAVAAFRAPGPACLLMLATAVPIAGAAVFRRARPPDRRDRRPRSGCGELRVRLDAPAQAERSRSVAHRCAASGARSRCAAEGLRIDDGGFGCNAARMDLGGRRLPLRGRRRGDARPRSGADRAAPGRWRPHRCCQSRRMAACAPGCTGSPCGDRSLLEPWLAELAAACAN